MVSDLVVSGLVRKAGEPGDYQFGVWHKSAFLKVLRLLRVLVEYVDSHYGMFLRIRHIDFFAAPVEHSETGFAHLLLRGRLSAYLRRFQQHQGALRIG